MWVLETGPINAAASEVTEVEQESPVSVKRFKLLQPQLQPRRERPLLEK